MKDLIFNELLKFLRKMTQWFIYDKKRILNGDFIMTLIVNNVITSL